MTKQIRTCRTSVIIATYRHNEGVLARVNTLRTYASDAICTVADNSPVSYKRKHTLRSDLKCIDPSIIYLDNESNNRFEAYNKALKTSASEYVMFRTDDDMFDEKAAFTAIQRGFDEDFIYSPYKYNNKLQDPSGYERPIESVIFKRHFLTTLLPFASTNGADWRLLERAFTTGFYSRIPTVILNKVLHGRSAVRA